jgi:transcriptional regulator GlxA family with amidase domain
MRRVVIVVFEGVQSLDVTGPLEVFSLADRIAGGAYELLVVSSDGGPVRTTSGLMLVPDRALSGCRGPIDTLMVAGGTGVKTAEEDAVLVAWLRRKAVRARRVASVCTGSFLLARAGLLDGRRATTHWAACAELERRYPTVDVDPEPIFVVSENLYTSAGVTAGMDLALALVEEDLGRRAALEVARWLVLFVRRSGGQVQFSTHLTAQLAEREPLRELQTWIAENLDRDLSVPALAARAHMSARNFARAFRREVGVTPGAYVEAARVEQARLRLETTDAKLEAVARDCGFGTVETMRRAFHRRVLVGPADYRTRFQAKGFQTKGGNDGDRHPAIRTLHGARRRRPI